MVRLGNAIWLIGIRIVVMTAAGNRMSTHPAASAIFDHSHTCSDPRGAWS